MKKSNADKARALASIIAGKRVALRNAINKLAELDWSAGSQAAEATADTFNRLGREITDTEVWRLHSVLNSELGTGNKQGVWMDRAYVAALEKRAKENSK